MNVKVLKKVRKYYTIKWVGVKNLIALDNENKKAESWGGTTDFVHNIAYEFFGLNTFLNRKNKTLKRWSRLNYFKHKDPEKYTWLKL